MYTKAQKVKLYPVDEERTMSKRSTVYVTVEDGPSLDVLECY